MFCILTNNLCNYKMDVLPGNIAMSINSFKFNAVPNTIKLEVADLTICIRSTNDKLLNAITSHYKNFISHNTNSTINIDIHLASQIHFPNPEGTDNFFNHQHFTENKCYVKSNYFTGCIDIERNYGKLVINELNPLSWLEHFLRITYAVIALKYETILFHGAGLIADNKGYIFFGPSGVGKSTVTNLSNHCTVLGDDLIAIKSDKNIFHVYATPFNYEGNGFVLSNSKARIKGFYRLVQDNQIYVEKMKPAKAIAELLSNIPPVNKNKEGSIHALNVCNQIIDKIACYELHFTKDNLFWRNINGKSAQISEKEQQFSVTCR